MTIIRVPNLPIGQIVNEKGFATDDELTFRQTLITQLQQNFGGEGCVVPTQTNEPASPTNTDPSQILSIRQIQDNRLPNGDYTCGFGRLIYDATNNRILVSIDSGGGVPKFAQINLTYPPVPAV